jgi:hypothetical protein
MKNISSAILILCLLLLPPANGLAFETDQFNLPPAPLADIGDEVSDHLAAEIARTVGELNGEIDRTERCLALETPPKGCPTGVKARNRLAYLRSPEGLAKAIFHRLSGDNLTTTHLGNWMRKHKFARQPDRYKVSFGETIYKIRPSVFLTMSDTVRLYDVELGIDKLEHFIQQGHQYYERESDALREGKKAFYALRRAIDWGKRTERTYYGALTSGVYSNADLYANYAGLRFYQGLTRPIESDGQSRPPLLKLTDGRWELARSGLLREHLLKPFITQHMNEALNPSSYALHLYPFVKLAIRRHACQDWYRTFPRMTSAELDELSAKLMRWHGEDYGYTKRSRTIKLSEICFEGRDERKPAQALGLANIPATQPGFGKDQRVKEPFR